MADTIESFVAKLQADGVETGKAEAEKITADATADAERIVANARAEAEKIIADAQADADGLLARGRTELALAARDTTLKLNEALSGALTRIVSESVAKPMSDPQFLGSLLHEVVLIYVKGLQQRGEVMTLNVPESLQEQLTDWAMHEIGQGAIEGSRGSVDLKAALAGAGFEYTVSGATVEVTPESVTTALTEMLTPRLREILAAQAGA